MSKGNSLINLGDISRPATVLIEKISDAIGGYFKPHQIKRVAKAESEAEIIRAQAQIEVTDLQRRAMVRWIAEEAQKQDNIENITLKALPELEDSANPQNIENDWITNFFDKCRIISDEEMQTMWAKVLAGEANSPGTYSKRTVNFLDSIDKVDAQLFTSLCGFIFFTKNEGLLPFIYYSNLDMSLKFDPIYTDRGINHDSLLHLDNIGLINFNVDGFLTDELPKQVTMNYYGTSIDLEISGKCTAWPGRIMHGTVLLTKIGKQLAPICDSKPVDGFPKYVIQMLFREGYIKSPLPSPK
jgi:hypothetical protein